MRRTILGLFLLVLSAPFVLGASVTPPANLPAYYSTYIDNKSGTTLVSSLTTICNDGYSGIKYGAGKTDENSVWSSFLITDIYPSDSISKAGKLWDMYSNVAWTDRNNQCGTYSNVGDCYNREHSLPKSWFGVSGDNISVGPATDMHHMYPTDGHVNNQRSNYPFGECSSGTRLINGDYYGTGKLGSSTLEGFTSIGTVWEPDDQYKGDFARTYMYMLMKWCASGTSFTQDGSSGNHGQKTFNNTFTSASNYGLTQYGVALLMKWHRQDPVSRKEIERNNAVQSVQGNRNPFIDYPYLAEFLWGTQKDQIFLLDNVVGSFEDDFVPGVSDGDKNSGGDDPIPADYYMSVDGLQDSLLKSKLAELTWAHYTKRYSYGSGKNNTWDAFWYTDRNETDNSVVDMYSNNKRYFNPDNTTASVTDCDIEHMFPNSWFGAKAGNAHAYCDLHHLVPADYSANRSKSNRGPGIPTDTTFNNGVWVNGRDANRSNLEVFCPPDEYKGDFARAFFYVAMTYGDTAVWQKEAVPNHMSNSDWHEFLPETRDLLLSWHRNDPVSEKERVRMNIVYGLQGNRNPFIDYPCLAEYIWGTMQGEPFDLSCGDTPTPKYTITWSINGVTSANQVIVNTQPTAPSVNDCSEDRVFMGWTTSNIVTDNPAVLYQPNQIPNATAPAIYYAVFADKGTSGGGSQTTTQFVYKDKGYTNGQEVTSVSQDGVTIGFGKGTNSLNPTYYDTGTAIRCYGGNTIAVSATNISQIVFTFASGEGSNAISANTGTYDETTKTWTGTADQVIFTIDGTTGHRRIKEMDVTFATSPTTVYSDYGLFCSEQEPVTVTFMNNGTEYTHITDKPGTDIFISDPTACDGYTFYGWSTYQYAIDNTDEPIVTTPTIIPAEDATYYAVYTSSEEGEDVLTDNYRKITTTSELTNANYLIVADTGSMVAMSSTFKSTYYLAPSLVEEEDGVISTTADSIIWQFTTGNNQLSFTSATKGNFYIHQNKTYYNIKLGNNTTDNKFSYSVNDGVWVLTSVSYPAQQLEFYRSQARWAFYTGQDAPVYLYKQVTEKETTTYYTTDPSCQADPATELETREVTTAPKCILMEGNIFILREGKLYNLQGIRVR